MIYEIRTYDLKPRSLPEYERRTAEKIGNRVKYSQLGGFWRTEIGPLNQVVHIWPYEDLNQRLEIRSTVIADGIWPPNNAEFTQNMVSEIFHPAPFMRPLTECSIGPLYEMRIYTYPNETIPQVLEDWGNAIEEREKLSPLAGCWYSEIGGLNRFIHMWAYRSADERSRIRQRAMDSGVWPPKSDVVPVRQETKLLLPLSFSPMQ